MGDDHGPSSAAILLGFLSGAALGAMAAVLLTPRAGHESREMLRGYAKRAEDRLRNFAGEAGHSLEEVVEQGRDFIESKKSVLREAFDAGREAVRRERERPSTEDQR
ncbi:MAG: YtxH domain-containing protein [Nitrospiraceae bacterium]